MQLDKATKQFIHEHANDDIRLLALKADKYSDIDFLLALQQINGRQKAQNKIPSWYKLDNILYAEQLSMEQCSSELTALYKASLVEKGSIFIDLTGGFGVDFSFIAPKFEKAIYVEQNAQLIDLAKNNFDVLNLLDTEIVKSEASLFLENYNQVADLIFIDPARRSTSGRKTVLIDDCTPNLLEINTLLEQKSKALMIKLSPMLDIKQALAALKNITEIYVISVNNECKELLFFRGNKIISEKIHCINIHSKNRIDCFTFNREEEFDSNVAYTSTILTYLYEPNSSILKAGAYRSIAARYNLKKLHPNSHLYTSDTLMPDFPGRVFVVEKEIPPNKKNIKNLLSVIKQANLKTRNYPISVSELKKQLKINDGGDYYIFATTFANEKKTLILCSKVPSKS